MKTEKTRDIVIYDYMFVRFDLFQFITIVSTHTDCGQVLTCGSNAYGQLGVRQPISHSTELLPIEVGNRGCGHHVIFVC